MSFIGINAHNIVYENNIIKSCTIVDVRNPADHKFFFVEHNGNKYTTKQIDHPFRNEMSDENETSDDNHVNESSMPRVFSSQANKNIVSNQIKTVKDLNDFKNTFGQGISLNE